MTARLRVKVRTGGETMDLSNSPPNALSIRQSRARPHMAGQEGEEDRDRDLDREEEWELW